MKSSPIPSNRPEVESLCKVSIWQKGRKTRTLTARQNDLWKTQVTVWGDARNLGTYGSPEAATTAANSTLEENPRAILMVVADDGHVVDTKYNVKVQQDLEFKRGLVFKALFFLACSIVPGLVFYHYAQQPSMSDATVLVVGIYALCWLFGFTQNVIEAGVIAFILMAVISVSIPMNSTISQAIKKHKEQHKTRSAE